MLVMVMLLGSVPMGVFASADSAASPAEVTVPAVEESVPTPNAEQKPGVKTGDETVVFPYLMVMLLALQGAAGVLIKKRKGRRK